MTRTKMALVATVAASVLAFSAPAFPAESQVVAIAIENAMIFDATGRAPFRGTVVVRDGRIAEVGPKVAIPKGAQLIDAQGMALVPGFFDVHTHWSPSGTPAALPQIASVYVRSGVTTVNDFHQQPEAFAPRREWLTTLAAPHVNFVARVSTPGGHGADWGDSNTTKWVASADTARRAIVDLQVYRPDYIKAFSDGWRYGSQPEETSMNIETLSALADEAHKHGQRVLSHTVTVTRGELAADAGVDVIAHSLQDREIDAATIEAMKDAGTNYAPTLAIYEPRDLLDADATTTATPAARQRLRKWGFALHNVKALADAGVNIVLGTDAGIGGAAHGISSLHEMELLVAAGLTPKAALMAGTANSAVALGLIDDRGTIETGKRADLVLLDGAPWDNIADVRKTVRVFIDGKQVLAPGIGLPAANNAVALPASPAAALIDDFERSDGRSALDTLRLSDMDGGVERSVVVSNFVPSGDGSKALEIATKMSLKDKPEGGFLVPLRRGSVQPIDARAFEGVEFDLRGAGDYLLVVVTSSGEWTAQAAGSADWRKVRIPFAALTAGRNPRNQAKSWQGNDLYQVGLLIQRKAGESDWVQVDNLSFYRE